MAKGFFIQDEFIEHFKSHARFYVSSIFAVVIGIIMSIILKVGDFNNISLLKSSGKILFDYINGSVDYLYVFFMRLKDVFLFLLILFSLNLTIYTSFLSLAFISYQVFLMVATSFAIIEMFGLSGVLNTIFFILPINILNVVVLITLNCVLMKRVYDAHKLKFSFKRSFLEGNVLRDCIICILGLVLVSVFNCFILPLFLKSFVILVY